jgi:hypothetical protein
MSSSRFLKATEVISQRTSMALAGALVASHSCSLVPFFSTSSDEVK